MNLFVCAPLCASPRSILLTRTHAPAPARYAPTKTFRQVALLHGHWDRRFLSRPRTGVDATNGSCRRTRSYASRRGAELAETRTEISPARHRIGFHAQIGTVAGSSRAVAV